MIQLEDLKVTLGSILNGHADEIVAIELPAERLDSLASIISDQLQPGDWILLDGDLGAGKTTLVSCLSKCLGVENILTSPTFSLIQSEKIESHPAIKKLVHLDLYRLKSDQELIYLGLENEFSKNNTVVFIEWPYQVTEEGFQHFFKVTNCQKPKRVLEISIELTESSRQYAFRKINFGG